MDETRETGDELRDELRRLGANLRVVLQEARESEEWKRLQADISGGFEEAARALHSAAEDFAASPSGQRIQEEMSALHERVRSGEVAESIRRDLLAALRTLNADLGARRPPPTDKGDAQSG